MVRTRKKRTYRGHTIEIILPISTRQCSQWRIYDYHGHTWDSGTLCHGTGYIFAHCEEAIDRKVGRERQILQHAVFEIEQYG